MKNIGVLSLIAVIALLVEGYLNGPDIWTMKYNFQGQPISTVTKEWFMIFSFGFLLLTNGIIFFVTKRFGKDESLRYINIPNKEFWEKPENRAEALRRTNQLLSGTQALANSVYIAVVIMARHLMIGSKANWFMFGIIGATFLFIFWTLWTFRVKVKS